MQLYFILHPQNNSNNEDYTSKKQANVCLLCDWHVEFALCLKGLLCYHDETKGLKPDKDDYKVMQNNPKNTRHNKYRMGQNQQKDTKRHKTTKKQKKGSNKSRETMIRKTRKILLQRQQKTPKDTKTHKIKMRWNVVNVKDTKRNHTSLWNAAFYYTPVKSCNYISNKADTICPWTGRQSDKQTPARAHKTMFVVLLSRTTFFLDDTHVCTHMHMPRWIISSYFSIQTSYSNLGSGADQSAREL